MDPLARTVVIVGAGFSGTALAIALLRGTPRMPLRVVLVERARFARGAAYGRHGHSYLLNVPAGRMSANPHDPEEFLRFARERLPQATGEDFLSRELYGDYLEASLATAEATRAPEIEVRRLRDEVIAVERVSRSARLEVHLDSSGCLEADAVVLALGNPPPATLPGGEALAAKARYVADPWAAPLRFRAGEKLLLVGTGLTMADVALAAARSTGERIELHALSRHGLLPAAQSTLPAHAPFDAAPLLSAASVSLRALVHTLRELAQERCARGADWRALITGMREVTPQLWQRLQPPERRRFLRHVRAYWDVHRHRLAAETWQGLQACMHSGVLAVYAGRLLGMEVSGPQVRVRWRRRGRTSVSVLSVDRVINCTGPDYDPERTRERLLRALIAQGLAQRDPLGLGLVTNDIGALIDRGGRATSNLFYLGPMLRPASWESTAVAELRTQAARLARHLCVEGPRAADRTWPPHGFSITPGERPGERPSAH